MTLVSEPGSSTAQFGRLPVDLTVGPLSTRNRFAQVLGVWQRAIPDAETIRPGLGSGRHFKLLIFRSAINANEDGSVY